MRRRRETEDLDLVRLYLDSIGPYEVLSLPEERALGHRIQTGIQAAQRLQQQPNEELAALVADGQQAERLLALHNLRLVVSVAKKFQRTDYPISDAIQDGTLGLFQAVKKYNPERPTKFATVAPWWIRQAIQRGMAEVISSVRMPAHVWDRLRQIHTTEIWLASARSSPVTIDDVAKELGDVPGKIQNLLAMEQTAASLDSPLAHTESSTTLGELVAHPDAVLPHDDSTFRHLVQQIDARLTDRKSVV